MSVAVDEDNFEQCGRRVNYKLQTCSRRGGYVFVRCGDRNLDDQYDYWGNIRFGTNSVEAADDEIPRSALRHIRIVGAGQFHYGTRILIYGKSGSINWQNV